MSDEKTTPNPGSFAAVEAGCLCPISDNNRGRTPPMAGGWWIEPECPLHGVDNIEIPSLGALLERANNSMTEALEAATDVEAELVEVKQRAESSDDLVVIPRSWDEIKGHRRHKHEGWTLHRADCQYAVRSTRKMPAPASPYPHTVSCAYCTPTGEPKRKFTRARAGSAPAKKAADKQAEKIVKEGGHASEYSRDGNDYLATCLADGCGIVGRGPSHDAARLNSYRQHKKASGNGTVPPLTALRQPRSAERGSAQGRIALDALDASERDAERHRRQAS